MKNRYYILLILLVLIFDYFIFIYNALQFVYSIKISNFILLHYQIYLTQMPLFINDSWIGKIMIRMGLELPEIKELLQMNILLCNQWLAAHNNFILFFNILNLFLKKRYFVVLNSQEDIDKIIPFFIRKELVFGFSNKILNLDLDSLLYKPSIFALYFILFILVVFFIEIIYDLYIYKYKKHK